MQGLSGGILRVSTSAHERLKSTWPQFTGHGHIIWVVPILVPLHIRCRNVICKQKGPIILRTAHLHSGAGLGASRGRVVNIWMFGADVTMSYECDNEFPHLGTVI